MEIGSRNDDQNRSERNKQVWKILLAVCLFSVAVVIAVLVWDVWNSRKEEQLLDQLADQTKPESESGSLLETDPTPEPSSMLMTSEKSWDELSLEEKNRKLEEVFGIHIPEKKIDFETLQNDVNPDIYAWVYIPDSAIDYPVLQHPEDNSYYLNYNIDRTKGFPGCIYTENYNSTDFSDHNTVLYGHNMKNGSMFAGLHQFEDADYFTQNPYIYIYTPEEVFVYRIFGAYEFSNIHLLAGYDTADEEGFKEYLDEVMKTHSVNSNFNREVEVTGNDRIITLSTCVYKKPDNRYLVQGVLLRIEEGLDCSKG